MFPIELFRTTSFRLAASLALLFGGATLLIFAFVYWQTAGSETRRIEALIADDARIAADEPTDELIRFVSTRLTNDFHHLAYAALFDAEGRRIAGNLDAMPPGLPPDGTVHVTRVIPAGRTEADAETIRAAERRRGDGTFVVVGRNSEQLERLSDEVSRALELGLLPIVLLALASGVFLSVRANARIKAVNDTAERIMRGQLRERLPVLGTTDDFDRLSGSVNRMLDEIERLLDEIKGTGDEIAHDLRTPLTRVRARLENVRRKRATAEELEATIDKAMEGLDQALSIITALLRIREIEAGRRRAGFGAVDLGEILTAIDELYQPVAEDKNIRLDFRIETVRPIRGDRDLLLEAIGNLVDNAIKFTPEGGEIHGWIGDSAHGPVVRIADSGPGIPAAEREMVLVRFYRSARNPPVAGVGLGLSLVAAIAKLHGAKLAFGDAAPGCVVELVFEDVIDDPTPVVEPALDAS